jgi:hypothetical protein
MSEIAQVIVEDLQAAPATPKAQEVTKELEKPQAEVEPQVEAKKEDEPLSVRFAALTKKEKMLQEREKALKEQESKFKNFELTKDTVRKNPKEALESIGLTFEDFTKAYLDQLDGKEHTPSTDDRINELYAKIEAKEKAEKEREEQARKDAEVEAIETFKGQIKDTLAKDVEKYELINEAGLFDEVYNVIEEYFNETLNETGKGEILTIERAAEQVENYLYEEGQKLLKAKKFAPKPQETGAKKQDTSPLATTLTNKQTANTTVAVPQSGQKLLSTEESLARAAALLKFK